MPRQKRVNPAALYFPKAIQDKLAYARHYPLTLASAPGGFGKSTAARHFLAREDRAGQVVWHSFIKKPGAAAWRDLCRAIGRVDEACGAEMAALGFAGGESLALAGEALENLVCPEERYLVLDSFELSGLAEPERLIGLLSRHGGEKLHILILTREGMEGLAPSHRIYRLGPRDFAFSLEDTLQYFALAGLRVSRAEAEAVHRASGGWVLVLYMQIQAYLKYGDFSNAGLGGLMEEVLWGSLCREEQDFFLAVSLFPSFSLQAAGSVSGRDLDFAERLLRGQPAFVHPGGEAGGYCLHSVFAAFLKERFQALPRERQRALYERAGDVACTEGDRHATLRFYYYSGNWEKLFALPLTSYELADVMDEETRPMILDVMDRAPYALKRKYPAAMVPLAFTLFFLHENQRLRLAQREIEEIIANSELPRERRDALLGEMDLLLSFLDYNRIGAMNERHRRALERLGGPASLIDVRSTWTFGAPSVLYLFWRERGALAEELAEMDSCMPVYYQLTRGHGSGAEHIMRAEALFQRGETEGAEILCHRALLAAQTNGQNSIYLCGLFLLSRIALLRGDGRELERLRDSIVQRARENSEDLCRYTQDLCLGFLLALRGERALMPPWLLEGDFGKRLVVMTEPFAHIILGRTLAKGGEYARLLGVCGHMLALSSIFPNLLPQVYCHIYEAWAHHALGRAKLAGEALRRALDIALPDGIYMPFAENYDGIGDILQALVLPHEQEAARGQIAALGERLKGAIGAIGAKKPALTQREREVYTLARQGLDNREIAAMLGIRISTVRNLLSHIYEKTGVSSKARLLLLEL